MNVGSDGVELIQAFESCELKAYRCPAGVWTIGWGHTGLEVRAGLVWTQEKADAEFLKDLEEFEQIVDRAVYVPLSQNQFDALVSFTFNVGPGGRQKDGFVALRNGEKSTLLKKVLARDVAGAEAEFKKWNRSAGRVMAGLTRRRNAEAALFTGSNWRQYL